MEKWEIRQELNEFLEESHTDLSKVEEEQWFIDHVVELIHDKELQIDLLKAELNRQ